MVLGSLSKFPYSDTFLLEFYTHLYFTKVAHCARAHDADVARLAAIGLGGTDVARRVSTEI